MLTPPSPSGADRPRYPYRAKVGRHWAGVAKGLGDYFGINPNWVRLAFMALTVIGGLGLAVYFAAWLCLPEEGDPEAGYSLFREGNGRTRTLLGIALVCLPLSFVADDSGLDGISGPAALIVAGVALWIWRAEELKRRAARARAWDPPTVPPATARAAGPTETPCRCRLVCQ